MNLLIVDDEVIVVDILATCIDWAALGFLCVYKAYNAEEARLIIQNEAIDILLCDIEMPQESGLELIAWINQVSSDTIAIILTSHSKFEYAKRSLSLGVYDYLLKPIPYPQLEQIVRMAINQRNEQAQKSIIQDLWKQNQRNLKLKFLFDLLDGYVLAKESSVSNAFTRYGLVGNAEQLMRLVIVFGAENYSSDWQTHIYGLENIACEVFCDTQDVQDSFAKGPHIILLFSGECAEASVTKHVETYLQICKDSAGYALTSLAGNASPMYDLRHAYQNILEQQKQILLPPGRLEYILENRFGNSITIPDLTEVKDLLLQRKLSEAEEQLFTCLDALSATGALTRDTHTKFQHEYLAIGKQLFNEQNVTQIIDKMPTDIYLSGTESTQGLRGWLSYITVQYMEILGRVTENSAVSFVREYVERHYRGQITRETLSQLCYLNPDYLNRLFKKEIGTSLMGYLQSIRLYHSKRLLRTTDLTASEIAMKVGYDSASYFTRIFKKTEGITPQEYRKNPM